MQINEITPAEQRRMFEKVKLVCDKHGPTVGNEAISVVFAELKKVSGGGTKPGKRQNVRRPLGCPTVCFLGSRV